jgi:hypothetical protein
MDRKRLMGRPAGVALISALMVMVILFIIASAFVHLTARDVRSARTVGDSLLTLYLAEAGIEYAMWMNKHNMAVYPFSDYDINDDGAADGRGSVAWLFKPRTGEITQEHVLINNLAYDATENWLESGQSCGTFEIYQTITQDTSDTDVWVITITSIGRIRRVPPGWSWSTDTLTSIDLASADWQLRSKRTLIAEVRLDTATGTLTTAEPAEIQESKWYELFR